MKQIKHFHLTIAMVLLSLPVFLFTQCTKDTEISHLDFQPLNGAGKVSMKDGWNFDKSHTSVMWETAYYGENAMLTGRFNMFRIEVEFDEKNVSASSINAWVQLSTMNTGEPGRDDAGKCGPGFMGIKYDTTGGNMTVIASSDTAKFVSTKIEAYGDGYVATGNFTFRGKTNQEKLYFRYIGTTESTTATGKRLRASFEGELAIKAKSVYGIETPNIADKVTIKVNAQYNKNI
jgi:polyisoprenoid-binding protein YceI